VLSPKPLRGLIKKALQASYAEFVSLASDCINLLASEKGRMGKLNVQGRLIEIDPTGEAIIIGDLHGDLESLGYILKDSRYIEKAKTNSDTLLIFLGDYGDRGSNSAEIYYLIMKLKHLFPQRVVLLRGNHEGPRDLLAHPHDLPSKLRAKYGDDGKILYSKIRELYEHLYTAVLVRDFCVMIHGGIPSQASTSDHLRYAHKMHPKERHLEEALWSDPSDSIKGTYPSPRGAGKLFGENVTQRFFKLMNVRMLIRGHEPTHEGFKTNHHGRILTLFSRKGPPYFNASAAYLQLDLSSKSNNAYEMVSCVKKF
jgi:protein phosphatase